MEVNQVTSLPAARAEAGLTMEELADKLGVTRQAVGMWEAGNAYPGGPARRMLAMIFGVELATVESWFEQQQEQREGVA